jgi:hypothetical protein
VYSAMARGELNPTAKKLEQWRQHLVWWRCKDDGYQLFSQHYIIIILGMLTRTWVQICHCVS